MILSQSVVENHPNSRVPHTRDIPRCQIIWAVPVSWASAHFLGFSAISQPRSVTAPSKLRPSPVLPGTGSVLSLSAGDTTLPSLARTMPYSGGSSESRARSPCSQSDPSQGESTKNLVTHAFLMLYPSPFMLTQVGQLASQLAP